MKNKKSDALANELMNDLLEEDPSQTEQKNGDEHKQEPVAHKSLDAFDEGTTIWFDKSRAKKEALKKSNQKEPRKSTQESAQTDRDITVWLNKRPYNKIAQPVAPETSEEKDFKKGNPASSDKSPSKENLQEVETERKKMTAQNPTELARDPEKENLQEVETERKKMTAQNPTELARDPEKENLQEVEAERKKMTTQDPTELARDPEKENLQEVETERKKMTTQDPTELARDPEKENLQEVEAERKKMTTQDPTELVGDLSEEMALESGSLEKSFTVPQDMTLPIPSLSSMPFRHAYMKKGPAYKSASELSSADIALAQSQNLKIAQSKIIEMEEEIESLRLDNDRLTVAGETLKERNEELISQLEEVRKSTKDELEQVWKEKEIISKILDEREKKINQLLSQKEHLEMRLESNFRKIRVRERELENRLELMKMEHTAINKSKDDIVLDLKRQVDQLSLELNSFRNRGHELNKQLNEKRETLQRTVKALRLALIMLERGEVKKSG